MRRILSLPFLQNHFYHLCHSSWLQIMSISTKFVQIASRSYTDLIQLKSRWREARTSLPGVLSAWKHPERSRRWTDRDTTIYEHKELFYYQIWKVPNKILAYYFQVYIFKKTISQKKSWKLLNITTIIGSTRNDSLSPLRTLSCKVHPEGGQVLREVAIMAESSEGSTDLASLLRTNKVEALQATVFCGPVKFIVWTRLPEDSSSWILK